MLGNTVAPPGYQPEFSEDKHLGYKYGIYSHLEETELLLTLGESRHFGVLVILIADQHLKRGACLHTLTTGRA